MVVNASFGFAMYPSDAKDATKLLRLADQRMYA
jgi:GGDEF domain-containing protein